MKPVLSMSSVSRTFGVGAASVAALRNVNLDVFPGEFVSIMGPSGSGKSTLLSIAGGLDHSSSGDVVINGTSLGGMSKNGLARMRRRNVGYVFQDYNLIPTLTVAENVALPLELDQTKPKEALDAALVALRRVGIEDLADRQIDQISGGQRQRVAIARGIIGERTLVLADEPTGALDSATGDEIMAALRELADSGVAVMLVTHEARHAGWADRVVFLRDGRVVDESSVNNSAESLLARTV